MKNYKAIICAVFVAGTLFGTSIKKETVCADYSSAAAAKTVATVQTNKSTAEKMTVSVSADCDNYNHVGNEWSESFQVNGKTVKNGDTVSLRAGDTVTVSSTVTEYDDSKDDVGSASASKKLTQSDIDKGFSMSLNVNVKENGGRYSGHVAKWTVDYSFR